MVLFGRRDLVPMGNCMVRGAKTGRSSYGSLRMARTDCGDSIRAFTESRGFWDISNYRRREPEGHWDGYINGRYPHKDDIARRLGRVASKDVVLDRNITYPR